MKNLNFTFTFGAKDYVKAANKASREMALDNGFKANHKVFKNKKAYDRKNNKKIDF